MYNTYIQGLVSIIIPVYNSDKYLKRCLESVINQDFDKIEIILVDDGSTDDSGQICDEYTKKYSNVFVYHKNNEGASLARMFGLRKAKGEYVTFVDSDDWIDKEYLSMLYKLLTDFHVSVSACSIQRVYDDTVFKTETNGHNTLLLKYEDLMPRFFKYEFWGFPGKLYFKKALDHIAFPKATLSEDYYVMAQLFNNERHMAFTDTPLYYYEYHDNSLSHQKISKRAFEEFENVNAVYEYTKQHMPKYADFALSNTVETCVKLLTLEQNKDKRISYREELSALSSFLYKHIKDIVLCKPLNFKIKLLSLLLSVSPNLFSRLVS